VVGACSLRFQVNDVQSIDAEVLQRNDRHVFDGWSVAGIRKRGWSIAGMRREIEVKGQC
jgi:hypothetical protein